MLYLPETSWEMKLLGKQQLKSLAVASVLSLFTLKKVMLSIVQV